ncbi:MAG: hypothetical protein RSA62_05775, partial [Oscillospiraceae bacterium]
MNEDCKTDILDLLLSKAPQYPTKKLKMNRLSEELDAEVVFEIRALSFNQIDDYIRNKDDSEINIILEGLVSPNIKDT